MGADLLLSDTLPAYPPTTYLSACPSIRPPVCLPICLFVCLLAAALLIPPHCINHPLMVPLLHNISINQRPVLITHPLFD